MFELIYQDLRKNSQGAKHEYARQPDGEEKNTGRN